MSGVASGPMLANLSSTPAIESQLGNETRFQAQDSAKPSAPKSVAETAAEQGGAATRSRLLAEGVDVPELPDSLPSPIQEFARQLLRALAHCYLEDETDQAVLLSLYERVATDSTLQDLDSAWRRAIEGGLARTETLQRADPPIRALRQAFSQARPSDTSGIYLNIDNELCRMAFTALAETDPEAMALTVRIHPLERQALREVETICLASAAAELSERQFPEVVGAWQLRKLVGRLYAKAFRGRVVRQVSVPGDWEDLPDGTGRVLRAVVGTRVRKPGAGAPCLMEEVVVQGSGSDRYGARSSCCTVINSVPILCEQIE